MDTKQDPGLAPGDEKPQIDRMRTESVVMDDEKAGAAEAGVDYTGSAAKTDPAEIKLVRKLDWRIMPTLCIMYFLNYVDRNAIAQARLNNLEDDLGMSGFQFNTTVSMYVVPHVAMGVCRV